MRRSGRRPGLAVIAGVLARWPVAVAAVWLALGALSGQARADTDGDGDGGEAPVIVVDLRAGGPADAERVASTRDRLVAALAASGALAPRQDPGLADALAGVVASDGAVRAAAARAALARARNAYGDLDCEAARPAARDAVDALAALQAAGAAVTPALQQAHAYLLLCAHGAGQADAAMEAAYRLQRLAGAADPPPGVSDEVWRAYLPLDATASAHVVELIIETEPAGAAVWFDHRALGTAPVRVLAREGEHIVAGAHGQALASQRLRVSAGAGAAQTVTLAIPALAQPWQPQAEQVARWRSGQEPLDGAGLAALMATLGVRFALVISSPGRAEARARGEDDVVDLWALHAGEARARRLGRGRLDAPRDTVARLVDRAGGGDRRGPGSDPARQDEPLLRERDVPRRGEQGPGTGRKKWWVYATVIGAVVAGGLIIASQDLVDDRQRIELRWP